MCNDDADNDDLAVNKHKTIDYNKVKAPYSSQILEKRMYFVPFTKISLYSR